VIGQRIPPMEPPSAEAVSESRIGRFVEQLHTALSTEDLDFFYRLIARIAHEQELDVMDIAAALAFLGQRGRPLEVRDPQHRSEHRRDRRGSKPAERRDRAPRGERTQGSEHPAGEGRVDTRGGHRSRRDRFDDDQVRMVHYRIEVGRDDGVTPREIVGAIANEAGLEGRYIGRIDIRDDHCIVDLPHGMPKEIYRHLQGVFVCGKALRLHLADSEGHEARPQLRREAGPPRRTEGETRGRAEGKPERPRHGHGGPKPRHQADDGPHRSARPKPTKRKG